MDKEAEYRSMIITLGEKIKDDDLKNFIYYVDVKAKPKQYIKSAVDFFKHLEEKEMISAENTNYILTLIKNCVPHRNDLITIVKNYQKKAIQNNWMSRETTIDAVPVRTHYPGLQEVRLFLSKNYGRKWRFFMRYLGVSDEDIEFVEEKYQRNMVEQISQTFQIWLDNERERATLDRVKKALKKEDRNDLIGKIDSGDF